MGKEDLIGTWHLVSSEFRHADGEVTYPIGKNAVGLLIYTAKGYMAVQLMRTDRPTFASNDAFQGTPEEIKAAYEGFTAYFSLSSALDFAVWLHQHRREGQLTQEGVETLMTFSTEQGFALWLAWGTAMQGWALAEQGQVEEGMAQIRQCLDTSRATGAKLGRSHFLALLAEAHGKVGQAEEGLSALSEALTWVDQSGERFYEAELYRLKGELVLQSGVWSRESEAEKCFQKAIEIAQKQQAKSLELRAATSLARLWQSQRKRDEARELLEPVYSWFTEGFDTTDLIDAKTLLDELV
jgi:predicted ATPase